MSVILIIAIAVLLVAIIVPTSIYRASIAAKLGCEQAVDSGTRQMYDAYLNDSIHDVSEAKAFVTHVMVGWDNLCPGGGTMHIVYNPDDDRPYRLACGLHDKDEAERTRLNAMYVLDELREELRLRQAKGIQYPETLTVSLNSKDLTAVLNDHESGLVRGTYNTPGLEGTLVYYSIAGHSEFCADSGGEEGRIWYFSFADEVIQSIKQDKK